MEAAPWQLSPSTPGFLSRFREALALAGVQPERLRSELDARERAQLQRLYRTQCATGHASRVAQAAGSTSSAAGAAGTTATAAPTAAQTGAGCGAAAAAASSSSAESSSCEQPGTGASAASVQATPMAAPAAGTTSPGAGGSRCGLLGPAGEPARGSAEWLAAQAAYEDAHLGQFERIMPPAEPEQVRREWGFCCAVHAQPGLLCGVRLFG